MINLTESDFREFQDGFVEWQDRNRETLTQARIKDLHLKHNLLEMDFEWMRRRQDGCWIENEPKTSAIDLSDYVHFSRPRDGQLQMNNRMFGHVLVFTTLAVARTMGFDEELATSQTDHN